MQGMVTISIVTCNSHYIFNVLDQLKAELGTDSICDIHIYDNHSGTACPEKLTTYEPFITIHHAEENQGFGHSRNQVLFNVSTKYTIIFSPDALVTRGVLDRLLDRTRIDENIAVVSPKVLNEDGTTQYLVRQKLDVFGYMLRFILFQFVKKISDKRLSIYEYHDLLDTETTDIKMGSGCFMLTDREKFVKIGGFDERFFMYFENDDLCLRFSKTDYRVLYTPFETVVHMYEKDAHKGRKLFKIFMQSMGKLFNKWGWRFF